RWSQQVAEAAMALNLEAKGSDIELWVLGSLSKQAIVEFQNLGWKVFTDAGPRLIPPRST
ncbi:hypothetical protein, partial [Candidatus Albibeggiatoa sp. nov. BB20]|uniref:hypothetical protein n=1 Tax=Candidatus Albibeggiatoa sp. nov. BB20 TaxID=3162723 RepID=UPI0033653F30